MDEPEVNPVETDKSLIFQLFPQVFDWECFLTHGGQGKN